MMIDRLPKGGVHNVNIHGLRAIAVCGVVSHHFFAHANFRLPLLSETGGLLGVQLFFVISGYLIVQSASRLGLGSYFLRRVCRIFPAYWFATWLVAVGMSNKSPFFLFTDGWQGILHFLALSHLSPPALLRHDVLTVSWTLTVEWSWYLLVPIIVVCAQGFSERRYWLAVVIFLTGFSTIWVLLAQNGYLDFLMMGGARAVGHDQVTDFLRFAFITNAFPAQFGFFSLGAGVWYFHFCVGRLSLWFLLGVIAATVPFATQWNGILGVNPSIVSGIGLAAVLIVAVRLPAFPLRPIYWLGEISYPLYLLHVPAIVLAFNHFSLTGLMGASVAVSIMLLAAWLLHILVERPGMALGYWYSGRLFKT